jgi:hypothetical protein
MKYLTIPLDGKETTIELTQVQIVALLLDQMNPRISFFRDNQPFGELTTDQIVFALTNKKPEAFRKLKDSIHNNRGIVYPIWVEPLGKGKYKVIEGNSRVVAFQQLSREEPYEDRWKSILSYVLPQKVGEEQKDFIRLQSHLRGTTDWDAYEKAKYLYKLWHDDGWSITRLEKQTKMSEDQIKSNIEAYKIMEEQYLPSHADDPNEVSKFSYFVEFVNDKKLRKLVTDYCGGVPEFCEWVADKDRIPTGQDVRRLRDMLEIEEIRKAYLSKGFEASLHMLELQKPHLVSSFYRDIERALEGLKKISAQDLDEIIQESDSGKERLIKELASWSKRVVNLIEKEKNGLR